MCQPPLRCPYARNRIYCQPVRGLLLLLFVVFGFSSVFVLPPEDDSAIRHGLANLDCTPLLV